MTFMFMFKWLMILLLGIEFFADFIEKTNKRKNNKLELISYRIGAIAGLCMKLYVIYILVTMWNV